MSDGLNQRYFHIGDASIRFVTPLDENGLEMLESVGFPQDVVPKTQMKHVELLCHNRICHGVGIKNKHGGMEFFSSDLPMTLPITIDEPGTVCIPFKKAIRCKQCCLFVDLFDYLAYKTLLLKEQGRGLPERCDCIVLNDYRNLMDLLLDIEYYEHVSCCFPTSQTGKVLATTVMRRFKKSINCDYLYEGYDNLLALAKEVVNRHKNDHIYV